MESMALVPPTPLALAYVGVFFIKSEYIKQKQSKNLFTATCKASMGEARMWKKSRGEKITEAQSEHENQAMRKIKMIPNKRRATVSVYVLCKE